MREASPQCFLFPGRDLEARSQVGRFQCYRAHVGPNECWLTQSYYVHVLVRTNTSSRTAFFAYISKL